MTRYKNILGTIGNTPIVKLNNMAPADVNLYVKIESFNPMSSVKDRLALGIIEDAERSGKLSPGQTVIEATSGNTGIGLAMVCAVKGYPLVVTMAENFSVERRKLLRFLGARVVLTPAEEKGSGMLAKAEELAERHGYFFCRQFENQANARIHSQTTAGEILADFRENELDYWVTGAGSGGTLKGVASVLKKESPATKVVVWEPDNAQMLASGIRQFRDKSGTVAESHPRFRPHLMQGVSPDFIPSLTEEAILQRYVDHYVPVNGNAALDMSRRLAREEGIFVGISSGACLAASIELASNARKGSNILCMLADTAERYMSTALFDEVSEEMDDEEIALSRSTAGYRFDAKSPTTKVAVSRAELDTVDDWAVQKIVSDKKQPITMFALEWCEFCWSVRKLFSMLGVSYRSVDLDSVEYQDQDQDLGARYRKVLEKMSGERTLPQIFIGGERVGGCTELFDAYTTGRLQVMLDALNISYNENKGIDPYNLLPGWIEKRTA